MDRSPITLRAAASLSKTARHRPAGTDAGPRGALASKVFKEGSGAATPIFLCCERGGVGHLPLRLDPTLPPAPWWILCRSRGQQLPAPGESPLRHRRRTTEQGCVQCLIKYVDIIFFIHVHWRGIAAAGITFEIITETRYHS